MQQVRVKCGDADVRVVEGTSGDSEQQSQLLPIVVEVVVQGVI